MLLRGYGEGLRVWQKLVKFYLDRARGGGTSLPKWLFQSLIYCQKNHDSWHLSRDEMSKNETTSRHAEPNAGNDFLCYNRIGATIPCYENLFILSSWFQTGARLQRCKSIWLKKGPEIAERRTRQTWDSLKTFRKCNTVYIPNYMMDKGRFQKIKMEI